MITNCYRYAAPRHVVSRFFHARASLVATQHLSNRPQIVAAAFTAPPNQRDDPLSIVGHIEQKAVGTDEYAKHGVRKFGALDILVTIGGSRRRYTTREGDSP